MLKKIFIAVFALCIGTASFAHSNMGIANIKMEEDESSVLKKLETLGFKDLEGYNDPSYLSNVSKLYSSYYGWGGGLLKYGGLEWGRCEFGFNSDHKLVYINLYAEGVSDEDYLNFVDAYITKYKISDKSKKEIVKTGDDKKTYIEYFFEGMNPDDDYFIYTDHFPRGEHGVNLKIQNVWYADKNKEERLRQEKQLKAQKLIEEL